MSDFSYKSYSGYPRFYSFRALGSLQFSLEHSLAWGSDQLTLTKSLTTWKKVRSGKGSYRGLISYTLWQHLLAKVLLTDHSIRMTTHIITVFKIWKSWRVVGLGRITSTLWVVFPAQSHCIQYFHKERIASMITSKTLYTLMSSTKSCCSQVLCLSRAISCWITICSVTFLDFTSIWKKK